MYEILSILDLGYTHTVSYCNTYNVDINLIFQPEWFIYPWIYWSVSEEDSDWAWKTNRVTSGEVNMNNIFHTVVLVAVKTCGYQFIVGECSEFSVNHTH